MKHIFVYNPIAGRNNKEAAERLMEKLHEYDGKIDYEIYTTTAPGDATRFVRERAEAEKEELLRFYACGGDGTLNEVLHGVVGHENASLGCYPCGSGNDFVKYYGGAERFLDVDTLLAAVETPVDIMKIDDRYAINVTNFGFDTAVVRTMEKVRKKKVIGGKNAYTTGILTALLTAMRNRCTVSVDGEDINDGKCLLCTVACGGYVGGSFHCAPRSKNDDGLLEVCLVKPISHITFLRLMSSYTDGTHLDDPRFKKILTYRQGKSVHVSAPEGFAFSLDGELVTKNDFTIEVCPGAVRFAVPPLRAAENEQETKAVTV